MISLHSCKERFATPVILISKYEKSMRVQYPLMVVWTKDVCGIHARTHTHIHEAIITETSSYFIEWPLLRFQVPKSGRHTYASVVCGPKFVRLCLPYTRRPFICRSFQESPTNKRTRADEREKIYFRKSNNQNGKWTLDKVGCRRMKRKQWKKQNH